MTEVPKLGALREVARDNMLYICCGPNSGFQIPVPIEKDSLTLQSTLNLLGNKSAWYTG